MKFVLSTKENKTIGSRVIPLMNPSFKWNNSYVAFSHEMWLVLSNNNCAMHFIRESFTGLYYLLNSELLEEWNEFVRVNLLISKVNSEKKKPC